METAGINTRCSAETCFKGVEINCLLISGPWRGRIAFPVCIAVREREREREREGGGGGGAGPVN